MKYIFILNEMAGRGKSLKLLPNIEKSCKKRNIEYEVRYITKDISGVQIASEYKDEENVIYVAGGDGSITITLPGIIGTKNKLGIIPAGSGNDSYKTVRNLPKGETQIDLVKINDMPYINVACTGVDADVGNNMDILRKTKIPTNQLYNASLVYTFVNFKCNKIKMKTKTKIIDSRYTILTICNGGFYGGGFKISPKSQLTDGLLEIYYVEQMPKIKMIPLILKLKKGEHVGKRRVHKYRANHIEIEFDDEVIFNVDGERLTDKNFVIDLLPKAITIYNDDELVQEIMKAEDREEVLK